MNERAGSAMRLLYQLFVALNRMKVSHCRPCAVILVSEVPQKQDMNEQSLEFTRSPGRMRLEKVETSIFQEVNQHYQSLICHHTLVIVDCRG